MVDTTEEEKIKKDVKQQLERIRRQGISSRQDKENIWREEMRFLTEKKLKEKKSAGEIDKLYESHRAKYDKYAIGGKSRWRKLVEAWRKWQAEGKIITSATSGISGKPGFERDRILQDETWYKALPPGKIGKIVQSFLSGTKYDWAYEPRYKKMPKSSIRFKEDGKGGVDFIPDEQQRGSLSQWAIGKMIEEHKKYNKNTDGTYKPFNIDSKFSERNHYLIARTCTSKEEGLGVTFDKNKDFVIGNHLSKTEKLVAKLKGEVVGNFFSDYVNARMKKQGISVPQKERPEEKIAEAEKKKEAEKRPELKPGTASIGTRT